MTHALALAGGGTKGAFEVGALEFLTRDRDFFPRIIAGTSAGAIIAGTLSQARTADEFADLTQIVRSNVVAVSDINSVFGQQPWLAEIDSTPFAELIEQVLSQRTRIELPEDEVDEPPEPEPHPEEPEGAFRARLQAFRDRRAKRRNERQHRTLISMSAALSNAPAMVRAGRSFLSEHRSIMTMEPLAASLRGERFAGIQAINEPRVAASGNTLRLVTTALSAGVPRYVTETGEMVERDSRTIHAGAGTPGVVEGMLASSAVPGLFPPRQIGDDAYTDGGVVQNIPIEAAVGAGAMDVTALLASPIDKARDDTDYTQASLRAVYARSQVGIAVAEQQRLALRHPMPDGGRLRVIAPTVDVVGAFEVEPGLIRVDFGYGWMRAAEVCAGLSPLAVWEDSPCGSATLAAAEAAAVTALSDLIATERERSWVLEEEVLRKGPSTALEKALRASRTTTVDAVTRWVTFGLTPAPGMNLWGNRWEEHSLEIPEPALGYAMP